MGITLCAIALGLSLITNGSAQGKAHVVLPGETLSHIAARYGVSVERLSQANGLSNVHKLSIGMQLRVPAALKPAAQKASPASGAKKNCAALKGDTDWSIAKRLGVSVQALHQANPGIDWRKLQIGQTLRIPGAHKQSIFAKALAAPSLAKPASAAPASGKAYAVRKGDNDWVIAARVGTTPSKLRAANPGVLWTKLQIGQTLRLPSGARFASLGGPDPRPVLSRHAYLARDAVNIRRSPNTNAAVVAKGNKGTYVSVLDRESGWYKLKFPRGTVGWVRGDMLQPISATRVAQLRRTATNRTTTRNPRSQPASGGKKTYVAYHPATGHAVVDSAIDLLGTRYRWAQASRSGTDCSGLTTQVYKQYGVKLPRRSREQAKVGMAVSKDELKPGDLVFFKTNRGSRINHVGIYMGDGKFVHASSSKGSVRVDRLDDGYYQRRYAAARRVKSSKPPAKKPKPKEEDADPKKEAEKSSVPPDGAPDPAGDGGG